MTCIHIYIIYIMCISIVWPPSVLTQICCPSRRTIWKPDSLMASWLASLEPSHVPKAIVLQKCTHYSTATSNTKESTEYIFESWYTLPILIWSKRFTWQLSRVTLCIALEWFNSSQYNQIKIDKQWQIQHVSSCIWIFQQTYHMKWNPDNIVANQRKELQLLFQKENEKIPRLRFLHVIASFSRPFWWKAGPNPFQLWPACRFCTTSPKIVIIRR